MRVAKNYAMLHSLGLKKINISKFLDPQKKKKQRNQKRQNNLIEEVVDDVDYTPSLGELVDTPTEDAENGDIDIENNHLETEDTPGMDECILPQDVMLEILSWLPIESIIRFSCVCRDFDDCLKRDYFIDLHLSRSKERFFLEKRGHGAPLKSLKLIEDVDMEGFSLKIRKIPIHFGDMDVFPTISSSNGLLCAVRSHDDDQALVVYNPITKESIKLPLSDLQGKRLLSIGFGYDPKSKKYKIVRLSEDDDEEEEGIIRKGEIFTLGDSSWRCLDVPFSVIVGRSFSPLFHNGAFHWIVDKEIHLDDSGTFEKILIFDISTEVFSVHNFKMDIIHPETTLLLNRGGHFFLTEQHLPGEEEIIDIYRLELNKSSSVGQFQHKRYHLPSSRPLALFMICFLKDDVFLIEEVNLRSSSEADNLTIYCPRTESYQYINLCGIPRSFTTHVFVPSFVSPRVNLNEINCGDRVPERFTWFPRGFLNRARFRNFHSVY